MPNQVESEALKLFVQFVRMNPQISDADPSLLRVLEGYRRSVRALQRDEARKASREPVMP